MNGGPDRSSPSPGGAWLTPGRARIVIALLVLLAYTPSLFGEFLYDDHRFVDENAAAMALTPANAVRYFTDPSTMARVDWAGIYRPLRTLDFAVDWSLSGGSPWFFHARSVIYQVIGAWLVLALFGHLLGADGRTERVVDPRAFLGALVFALHPVQTESVAWISSRADVLSLCLFLGALMLHLRGSRLAAALVLVLAVLAKESAVVFVAAAFLADRYRRSRGRWGWYGVYAGIGIAFFAFWKLHIAAGSPLGMGQTPDWFGGSYGMNLLTVARGFVYYAKLLLLPVEQVVDYYVPARATVDAGGVVSAVLVAALIAGALLTGRRSRFALLWFAATILPVSGLVVKMSVPTAERFLLLPSVGIAFWAGHLAPRSRLAWVVPLCLLALTFTRCFAWRDEATLWHESLLVANTPRGLAWRSFDEIERAEVSGDPADAERVIRTSDELLRLYREDIQFWPPTTTGSVLFLGESGGKVLWNRARALLLLGRYDEALRAAEHAARTGAPPEAHSTAGLALERRGELLPAANAHRISIESGAGDPEVPRHLVRVLNRIARDHEEARRWDEALRFYEESLKVLSDPRENPEAAEAVRRLGR